MATKKNKPIFDTKRRIKLGIWGLGRGLSFFQCCSLLNIDVVAGCDYNEAMRKDFSRFCPDAFVTDDIDEFLKQDLDAVVVATFCPAHADDAIKCLKAGKHVISEVTAFHTMAEGVRLVEEVEKSGLVYNLAENYPFTAANTWLANRWKEGLFGDLMYAEYEYVHECRSLAYTYINGQPVQPGHTPHNWRSWLNFHYYCTHSLGPVMVITGTRPVRVQAFPCKPTIAGYLQTEKSESMGSMTPSMIVMSNGAVVRNLMGAGTNDSHAARLWGTRGASEIGHDGLRLRLGASGGSPAGLVKPEWEGLGEIAAQTGHGGGDFWTLYYFAREILTGEKGPFDIYGAADVTIPGILARRSSLNGGQPYDVPDFRSKTARNKYRNDDDAQVRYDVKRGVFGNAKLDERASRFTTIMNDLINSTTAYRAYVDWKKVENAMINGRKFLPIAEKLQSMQSVLVDSYRDARAIIDAYPGTDGAKVLAEMLEVGDEKKATAPQFFSQLKRDIARLRRKFPAAAAPLGNLKISLQQPLVQGGIRKVAYPKRGLKYQDGIYNAEWNFIDTRPAHTGDKKGIVYVKGTVLQDKQGTGKLFFGADGPVKVFLNGEEVACKPKASNPIRTAEYSADVRWNKGRNEVVFALDLNEGRAWGVSYGEAK